MEIGNWCDEGESPSAPPHAPVQRFKHRGTRYRVVLLDRVRLKKMHKKSAENSVPCLKPAPCPFCDDRLYDKRKEGWAPAAFLELREYRETHPDGMWVPVIAVFTGGGFAQIEGAEPHFGREYEVSRVIQGTAGGGSGVLKLKLLGRTEPPLAPFDIIGHCIRLWTKEPVPVADLPAPVPYVPPAKGKPADAVEEPTVLTPGQVERLMRQAEQLREEGHKHLADKIDADLAAAAGRAAAMPSTAHVVQTTITAEHNGRQVVKTFTNGRPTTTAVDPKPLNHGAAAIGDTLTGLADSFKATDLTEQPAGRNGHHKAGKGGGS